MDESEVGYLKGLIGRDQGLRDALKELDNLTRDKSGIVSAAILDAVKEVSKKTDTWEESVRS
jgi:hypothetical protein